jgi:hypothetical protein
MTAKLIDGIALSRTLRAEVAVRAAALRERGTPAGLAVILVGDDPASQVYVRNKIKACEECGVRSIFERYDASLSEAALLARIATSTRRRSSPPSPRPRTSTASRCIRPAAWWRACRGCARPRPMAA